jgi:UDP-N-acetylglucosamine:LPS N-acetylglucosamine transferase
MSNKKPLVVLSMLNWGFGHLTRCFPIILSLIELKKQLLIVCTPAQQEVLAKSFDGLIFFNAADDAPKYGKTKAATLFKLSLQAPFQLMKVKRDNKIVARLSQQYDIELIISDNKYGFYHPEIPSVILTHQLNIQTGLGKWADAVANRINRKLLSRFNEVWVVDGVGLNSLAGSLSAASDNIQVPVKWIGALNRLQTQAQKGSEKLLIILSGPEPQRTVLEELIVNQLPVNNRHITFIRGTKKEFSAQALQKLSSLQFTNWIDLAGLAEIEHLLSQTEWVMGRAGYTSLMEWITGGWKSIVIPTPGQAEQEYLACYLMQRGWVFSVEQNDFNLQNCIKKAAAFSYNDIRPAAADKNEIKALIASLLSSSSNHIE